MTLHDFWNIIESSWEDSPELNHQRLEAIKTGDEELLNDLSMELEGEILENYNERLSHLDKQELTSFIRHFEERMYHIDRQAIHQNTDGSDDGFLYCRCFIVGMGKTYYDMIDKDPSKATADLEAEPFGFSAYDVYEELFGEDFDRYAFHSMETGSNKEQWIFE
ncbi:MAG: DUF4240 domain-containing protein [Flavipsychrobacter sp.]|jgi:hypothetical protein|nr:DUF4240 domain-containing protein [Flavipsychrobacter sp.]